VLRASLLWRHANVSLTTNGSQNTGFKD